MSVWSCMVSRHSLDAIIRSHLLAGGKVKPFKTFLKVKEWANLFSEVGKSTELASNVLVGLERFVCMIYCRPSHDDTNILRYEAHLESKTISVAEGIDCLLPPCCSSLTMHSKRANYVATYIVSECVAPHCQRLEIII